MYSSFLLYLMIAYKVIHTNTTFVQQGIPEQCKLPCYREFISFGTIVEPRAIANDDMMFATDSPNTNRWYFVVDRIWCERRMCTTRHVDAIVDIGPVCMRDDGNSLDFVASCCYVYVCTLVYLN
jgi:hypothetical protein